MYDDIYNRNVFIWLSYNIMASIYVFIYWVFIGIFYFPYSSIILTLGSCEFGVEVITLEIKENILRESNK